MLYWFCTHFLWAGCPGGSKMENNIFGKLDVLNTSSERIYSFEYIGKVYILRLDARDILYTFDYSEALEFIQELLDGHFFQAAGWLDEAEKNILSIA
jgi:hypothetical protein